MAHRVYKSLDHVLHLCPNLDGGGVKKCDFVRFCAILCDFVRFWLYRSMTFKFEPLLFRNELKYLIFFSLECIDDRTMSLLNLVQIGPRPFEHTHTYPGIGAPP